MEEVPFTQNDHYFASYREKYLARYKKERKVSIHSADNFDILIRVQATSGVYVAVQDPAMAIAELAKIGYNGISREDLDRLLGADEFEQDLMLMAEVGAYFRVAYKVCATCYDTFISLSLT